MRIIVCVKQVPDIAEMETMETDPETGTIIREGLPAIVNPFDEYALEEAVSLKEKLGGEVIALSMGPPQAEDALIKCLSMGADQAVLLSDRAFAGADTLATAYAIAGAVKKLGEFDLIFCGQQAIDGDTAQVGPMLAENLHIPQITYVNRVEVDNKHVVGTREVEEGYERIRCKMPVLIAVVKGIKVPRVPTYSDLSDAMDKEIPVWSARELDLEERFLGLGGSPTAVTKVWTPEPRPGGQVLTGDPAELAVTLADILLDATGVIGD
ncbi:MAG: electron transfer flavoprotein subunit beta/FixA family protein [Deltaproteobacteria bacterium]|nr:electron transfer flavoprotein subunit beta/FixA family protein [Deltaproteobacteria bacterium]